MFNALKKALKQLQPKETFEQRVRRLIHREAELGGTLFGQIPQGHRRDFFYLGDNTWIWHEGWRDENGKEKIVTTRYEVSQDHIMKVQDGMPYQKLEGEEAINFYNATLAYFELIKSQLYSNLAQ